MYYLYIYISINIYYIYIYICMYKKKTYNITHVKNTTHHDVIEVKWAVVPICNLIHITRGPMTPKVLA